MPVSTPPRPRDTIASIPAYVAGKPPAPRPGQQVYKLSSNENPHPPLPGVVEAAEAAVAQMNRYPDMGNSALYAALSERLGVPQERLAAGTGSVAVLYHLLQAFCDPGDEVVYAWRSFEAYPIAVSATGAVSVQVPVDADGRHDLDAMAAAVTDRTKVVVVCTPNNPTGPSVTDSELRAFVAKVPDHVLVVVDEAYREFVREEDPVDGLALAAEHANVAVMRTFAKAYGLAGFRVGYLVAHADVAAPGPRLRAALRRLQRGAGGGRRQPRRRGRAARVGWTRSWASGSAWSLPSRSRAGPSPCPRATSSGCRWASGRPSWSRSPRRPASPSARSPVRVCGSPSASPRPTTSSCRWRNGSAPEPAPAD